jgi:flagellar assembly protein FliH
MWSEPGKTARRAHSPKELSPFWDAPEPTEPVTVVPLISSPHKPLPPAQPAQAAHAPAPAAAPGDAAHEVRPSFAELERDAFTKGYSQGERAGAEAAARRGEAMLRRLAQTVEELAGLRGELIQKTERQVVQLALAIAERILRREVSLDRDLLIAMARVALERLGENTAATIRLNPADHAHIGDAARVSEGSIVRIVADPLVSSGGCLVQSDFGLIDVGIDAQLNELASALGVTAAGTHVRTIEQGAA